MLDRNDPSFWSDLFETILQGAGETLYTVGFSLLFTVIFGLATLMGAMAPSIGVLIFSRILNGIGLGASIPCGQIGRLVQT